jgi:flotillin
MEVQLLLICVALAAFASVVAIALRRVVVAKPNEWLLVIANGEMVKAGIGLRAFRGLNQQVVRFPSAIQKVQFNAQQVTQEMQGIEVSGFVIWVVFREEDGPFKAYRYLDGLGTGTGETPRANENIARMAESIIRHQVANSTISEVIANRATLRDKIRLEMQAVVQGWGVWLETVEITDVVICSEALFGDLQAPYRQKTHAEAEQIRVKTKQTLEQHQMDVDLDLAKQRADTKNERIVYEARLALESEQERAKLLEEQTRIKRVRLEQQHELAQLETEHQEQDASRRAAAELGRRKDALALENTMTPLNLRRELLDTIAKIYAELPLESVKLINMGADQGVESLLTNVVAGVRRASEELE